MFILETKEDVLEFKDQIEKNVENKIIASSIESHQYLKEIGIPHEIIDNYFTKSDYEKMDTITVNFTLNWYKQKDLQLDYEGLKIGFLIESQIGQIFLKIVRRFFCVKTIIDKIKPQKLFVGTLASITKIFVEKYNIEVTDQIIKKETKSEVDNIEIPFPFTKSHSLKISRNQYFKMKKIVEKIILTTSNSSTGSKKSILLLDFNPIYFQDLLIKLAENFDDVFLLNQRRPAIWNLESLKLIKNSNCKVLRLEDFDDDDSKKEIKVKQTEFSEKIDEFKNNSCLVEYFSINEFSLWRIIQEELINILKSRAKEAIYRNILIKKFLSSTRISCILEWAYTGFEERIVNHLAEKQKIPIIFLQHSAQPENPKWDIFFPLQPIFPRKDDKIAVYGNSMYDFLKAKNVLENNIIVSGSPRHDSFFKEKNHIKNDNTIVIATTSSSSIYTADGIDIRSFETWGKSIQKLLIEIRKFPEKKPIIKLHPNKEYFDIKSFIKKIDKNIDIYKEQKTINVLKNCDMLIVTNFSTILHEAMILQKPTMMISTQNLNWKDEPIVKNNATMFVSEISEIEKSLDKICNDKKYREKLITNASNYINKYFINQGKSSDYLAKELSKLS